MLDIEAVHTVTLSGRTFEIRSKDWIIQALRERLGSLAEILTADRPLFSDHWIVTFQPLLTMPRVLNIIVRSESMLAPPSSTTRTPC